MRNVSLMIIWPLIWRRAGRVVSQLAAVAGQLRLALDADEDADEDADDTSENSSQTVTLSQGRQRLPLENWTAIVSTESGSQSSAEVRNSSHTIVLPSDRSLGRGHMAKWMVFGIKTSEAKRC